MITAKETYEQFCQDWKIIGSDLPWYGKATPWTKKIFQYFSDEGKKINFKVYADSGMIAGTQEYMVDLCWSNEDKDKYYGLELAMESEWSENEDEILYDFSKIVDIKSYLKIMIISVQENKINGIIDKMSSMILEGKIKLPNEEYLVIIFTDDFERAENERIGISGFRIDNDGRLDKLPAHRFADGVSKSQEP
jgi:hypothetical protein